MIRWHKTSEELPPHKGVKIGAYRNHWKVGRYTFRILTYKAGAWFDDYAVESPVYWADVEDVEKTLPGQEAYITKMEDVAKLFQWEKDHDI